VKKSKFFILCSALLALIMVLAACKDGATTQQTTTQVTGTVQPTGTTTTTSTPPVTIPPTVDMSVTPIYGGTGVFLETASPYRWDPGELAHLQNPTAVVETLWGADWTKGPQGTNEFPFNQQHIPDAFMIGLLAETIEQIDPYTAIYTLRKGITYWGNNPKVPGYGAEMVAADYIAASNRTQSMARSVNYRAKGEADPNWVKAEAVPGNKYAIKITTPQPRVNNSSGVISGVYPAASTALDLSDWRNACGTGPFVVTDFVPDSSITYIANPNYWQNDPLRPTYKRPYLDGYRTLIIVDPATQQAAIQTGKILIYGTTRDRGEFLLKNNPELKYTTRPENYNIVIFMRLDKEPYNKLQVRRALAIAIDRKGILNDFMEGQGYLIAWPVWDSVGETIFTPLEKLPADVQELFDYNPTKAKQMLAEAGYPNGFTLELLSPQVESYVDRANIVKSYWDAIGVKTTVNVIESGTFYDRLYGKNYQDTAIVAWGNSSKWSTLGWCWRSNIIYNYGKVNDPKIDQAYLDALDLGGQGKLAEQDKLFKDIYVYGMQQAWEICLPQPVTYVFWQPYMYGYVGEYAGVASRVWIDPEGKKAAGH